MVIQYCIYNYDTRYWYLPPSSIAGEYVVCNGTVSEIMCADRFQFGINSYSLLYSATIYTFIDDADGWHDGRHYSQKNWWKYDQ